MKLQRAFTRLYVSERCMLVVCIGCIGSDAGSISAPFMLAPGYTCMLLAFQQPVITPLHSCNLLLSTLLSSSYTMLQVKIIHSWLKFMSGARGFESTFGVCKHPEPAQLLLQVIMQPLWPSGLP